MSKSGYNLFICSTVYHVLLSSLIANLNRDKKNILIVNVESFECGKTLDQNNGYIFFDEIYKITCSYVHINKFGYFSYRKNVSREMEKIIPKLKKLKAEKNNVRCFLCEDDHHFSRYFVFNFNNIIMLEEGMKVYCDLSKNESGFKKFVKYKFLNINVPNGVDDSISEIWVQHPKKLPMNTRKKGKKINLYDLMDNVSKSGHEKDLLNMLGINNVLWKELKHYFSNNKKI